VYLKIPVIPLLNTFFFTFSLSKLLIIPRWNKTRSIYAALWSEILKTALFKRGYLIAPQRSARSTRSVVCSTMLHFASLAPPRSALLRSLRSLPRFVRSLVGTSDFWLVLFDLWPLLIGQIIVCRENNRLKLVSRLFLFKIALWYQICLHTYANRKRFTCQALAYIFLAAESRMAMRARVSRREDHAPSLDLPSAENYQKANRSDFFPPHFIGKRRIFIRFASLIIFKKNVFFGAWIIKFHNSIEIIYDWFYTDFKF